MGDLRAGECPGAGGVPRLYRLAAPRPTTYSVAFNECRYLSPLLPPSSPVGNRGAFAGRDHAAARPLRELCRAEPPGRQEAGAAARPHRHQPVLRELDANPDLVRARG